jgi:thioredoxin-like negative regulator of GroEL
MPAGITKVTKENYATFITERRFAVLHFDTEWDVGGRPLMRLIMAAIMKEFPEGVNFGEVDCDVDVEPAKGIPVWNVPLVAYYRQGKLVAALVGMGQNVRERLRRVMKDEFIGHRDGTETLPHVPIDERELKRERDKAIAATHQQHRRGTNAD